MGMFELRLWQGLALTIDVIIRTDIRDRDLRKPWGLCRCQSTVPGADEE